MSTVTLNTPVLPGKARQESLHSESQSFCETKSATRRYQSLDKDQYAGCTLINIYSE